MSLVLFGLINDAGGHFMLLSHLSRSYFLPGIVRGLSLESTTKTANRLAGLLSLAFSLILWVLPAQESPRWINLTGIALLVALYAIEIAAFWHLLS
jgi:hypothetical protein